MARELPPVRREAPRLVAIQTVVNAAGRLGVIETQTHSPFDYERFYFLTDLPTDSRRGGHAHKSLRQVIICLRGHATVEVRSSTATELFQLTRCDQAIVLPAGYWRDLYGFSADALIGVLASDRYDEADYIRSWDEYVRWDRAVSQPAALASPPPPPDPVPYLDLARYVPLVGAAMLGAVARVVESGWLIGGAELHRFETAFAAYCEAGHGVGVGNGLQALTLLLRAAGVGPGDEVILPANSFIATALAVLEAGATPVLVDVEEETGLICPAATAAAVTPRTRAILPVHLHGHPADMDALRRIAAAAPGPAPVWLIEDACQAHGARYKGRRCGSLGDAAAFSFYPTKNLGALGDAGAVTTHDSALAERVRLLGNYGCTTKYHHVEIGTNSRLDPIQAAALGVKLPYLDSWNRIRAGHAALYRAALAGLSELELPAVHGWAEPVWHVFAIRVAARRRDALIRALAERGIGSNVHYPVPIHLQPCLAGRGWGQGSFPVAERLARTCISLPLDPTHTPEEIAHVADIVRTLCRSDDLPGAERPAALLPGVA